MLNHPLTDATREQRLAFAKHAAGCPACWDHARIKHESEPPLTQEEKEAIWQLAFEDQTQPEINE